MNSITLKQNGFAEFVPLKGLPFSSLPSNKSSVLILADTSPSEKPASDILYIGKSKNLPKKIFGGYLSGYGGKATRKINSKLFSDGYIEKVAVSWMLSEDPKATQTELLESFKKEHGKYPVWNAKKAPQKTQQPPPKTTKARPARKQAKASTTT